MEGIRNIAEKIRADGQAQVDKINSETQDAISQIFNQLENEIEKMTVDNDKRIQQDIEKLHRIMASNTVLELRNEKLRLKQEILDEVFEQALSKLVQKPASERIALLVELLKRINFTGNEAIAFCGNDKDIIASSVMDEINHYNKANRNETRWVESKKEIDSIGGFVIISEHFNQNYTFEAIIHRIRDDIEAEILDIIFG